MTPIQPTSPAEPARDKKKQGKAVRPEQNLPEGFEELLEKELEQAPKDIRPDADGVFRPDFKKKVDESYHPKPRENYFP